MDTFYKLIVEVQRIAISFLEGLSETFELIVIDNGTLGDFLTAVLPSDLSWVGTIVGGIVPIPILYIALTGIGFYYGVALVKWFLNLFK